jgi:outer membrane protein
MKELKTIYKSAAVAVLMALPTAQAQAITLADALAALPKALDWQSADLRFQGSVRALESAYAAAGLQIRGSGNITYTAPENTSDSSTNSLGLTASVNVLPWSPAYDQVRSAERALENATLDLRDLQAGLSISLVSQYFAVRTANVDLELAKANEALLAERAKIASLQQTAGQTPKEAVLQAQQALEAARVTRLQAEATLENAKIGLANLGSVGQPSTVPQALAMPTEPLQNLLDAVKSRSDVKKAQNQLRGAEDNLDTAQRARWFPPTSLNVSYGPRGQGAAGLSYSSNLDLYGGTLSAGVVQNGVNASQPSQPGQPSPSSALVVGLSMNLPLWAPSSDALIASAQNARDAALKSAESVRKAAELEVRQRYAEASTATARLKVQQLGLEQAAQALATAQARRLAGANTALDLQQAQINVQQAQQALEVAAASQMVSVYRLRAATGVSLFGGSL